MNLDIFDKKETLTTSESQSVVKDLKAELERVKYDIKNRGAVQVGVDFLESKRDLLQSKLDDLLKKGGVITEEDYNDTYAIIRSKEEKELKDLYKKANKRIVYLAIGVIAIVAIYLISKRK